MTKGEVKTGTTCIGVVFKDGVILAADRRTTSGHMIRRHDSIKLHKLTNHIAATHAGTVSDAQLYKRVITSQIKLHELKVERNVTVKEAAMIANNAQYQHIRTPSPLEPIVGYLVGGVDENGSGLYEVGADGTLMDFETYATDGSGSIFAMPVLHSEYKKDMSEKEALALVEKSIMSAIYHDSASGGGIVMFVITKDGIKEVIKKSLKSELVQDSTKSGENFS